MAPLIAIVGCDGAGKTTLTADLARTLGEERVVATRYLGLGTGAIAERIKRLPVVGRGIEHYLARKAKQTRTPGQKIPGLLTALVVLGLSLRRRRHFRQIVALREQGVLVLTDRYPQIEIAGFYDGPGLSAALPSNWLVAMIAARERMLYEVMAQDVPTLVIRLGVDAETAHARKPEHNMELLRRKVAVTPLLMFGGAPIVDLDSREPYARVRRQALDAIRHAVG